MELSGLLQRVQAGLWSWLYFTDICLSRKALFLLGEAVHEARPLPQPEAS